MTAVDPKWLELLKASGWQTAAIAVASGGFVAGGKLGWWPPLSSWMLQLSAFACLLCGCLAIASLITAVLRFFSVRDWIYHYITQYRSHKEWSEWFPYMTDKEKEIIGYLLHHRQKMLTVDIDGGHAATLIARGIILQVPRGVFSQSQVPAIVPDHVWKLLEKNRQHFPYVPPADDPYAATPAHPWRRHWMER